MTTKINIEILFKVIIYFGSSVLAKHDEVLHSGFGILDFRKLLPCLDLD